MIRAPGFSRTLEPWAEISERLRRKFKLHYQIQSKLLAGHDESSKFFPGAILLLNRIYDFKFAVG